MSTMDFLVATFLCYRDIGMPRSEMQVFGLLMLRGSGGAQVHGRGIRRTGIQMLDLLIHS
jgi:hypothetical protein